MRIIEPDSITAMLARGDKAGAIEKFNRFRDELHAEVMEYETNGEGAKTHTGAAGLQYRSREAAPDKARGAKDPCPA